MRSAALPPARPLKVVVAAGIGTAFEVYDFTLFAFFSAMIAPAFFPSTDPRTSLLLTAATFGIGALMRPIGAVVFGLYGDRVGRKAVLTITIMLMAAGSVMLGLIPDYSVIGLLAPLLAIVARIMQGFSAGGEQGGAATFIVEHVPRDRCGFYLGFHGTASLGATLFSAMLGLLLNRALGPVALADWGWRIPFLLGGLIAPVGFYVRARLPESAEFIAGKAMLAARPAAPPPRIGYGKLLLVMCGFIPGTVVNYLGMVYMPTYLRTQTHVSLNVAFTGVLIGSVLVAVLMPVVGGLSDRIGRRPLILVGCALIVIGSYPLYLCLQGNPGPGIVIPIQCMFGLLMALTSAPALPLAAEHFPTMRRSLGMSIGMTLPIAVFGVCSPLIVTSLIIVTASALAPAFYLMAAALVGIVVFWFLEERPATADGIHD